MLPTNSLIQILQQNKPFLQERFGVESLVLFGSYARNNQREESDVDLLYGVVPGKTIIRIRKIEQTPAVGLWEDRSLVFRKASL